MDNEVAATPQHVGAGRAFAIFVLYNLAQLAVAIAGIIVAVIVATVRDADVMQTTKHLDVYLLVPAFIAGLFVFYLLLRSWTPLWWHEQRAEGFGTSRLSARRVAIAAACGVALAVAFVAVSTRFPPTDPSQIGPLSQLAHRGGIARAMIVILAIVLAPPVEEVLFRGVMLDGFTESWGFAPAAVIVTLLFMAMHLLDIVHYWPGAAAILGLALTTLTVRRRTGSIAAAMIVHAVYNAGVCLRMYLS